MLAKLTEVRVIAILADVLPQPFESRFRNLRRNIKREGIGYIGYRVFEFLLEGLERLASRLVPPESVGKLLQEAFPEREFSLADFGRKRGIPVQLIGNLNGPPAAAALRELDADLGIVLGTRILKPSTFSIPRMGCINLHKGKVPEYRGMPPGFWELYDGQTSAGVTVHKVDDGLDTGDVLGTQTVPIHPKDTPVTLRRKLDRSGSELLVRCVLQWARGAMEGRRQPCSSLKARTSPTRRERAHVDEKLGIDSHWMTSCSYFLKTLFYLAILYGGVFHLVRGWRRVRGISRACILLYHRVNDDSEDPLTTSVWRFAEHMAVIKKYYTVLPTASVVRAVKMNQRMPHHAIAIHFDDCYRDIYTNASRVLAQMRFPACCFISSGFVGTDRIFPHDVEKCPFRMENLTAQDLVALTQCGFDVGAHTVNHTDLGQCSHQEATAEIVESKNQLERWLHRSVTLFSYPYGERRNISRDAINIVRRSGYEALFSAYGGYVGADSDLYDLPRWSMSGRFRPIDFLMEIEGLSIAAWRRRLSSIALRHRATQERSTVPQRAVRVQE
jgi:peptidoglycan/xylan/chitin deacetylase (PgdA/CDA1 family)